MKNTQFSEFVRIPPEVLWRRVKTVMEQELTEIERTTLTAYHLEGKRLWQIAAEKDVNQSTVWRNLKRAEKKVRRFLQY